MKAARKAFVTRIAKFTGIIPNDSYLKNQKGCSNTYKVMVWNQDLHKSIERPSLELYVYVDKLKSGKHAVRIKQRGEWKSGLDAELQQGFNPNRIKVVQRRNRPHGMLPMNVLQLTCEGGLPWRHE